MNLMFYDKKGRRIWSLLDDRIITENEEVMISEIKMVTHSSKSVRITNNIELIGVIHIDRINKKGFNLIYFHESREDAEKALNYLINNCNIKEYNVAKEWNSLKSQIKDCGDEENNKKNKIKNEIKSLPYKDTIGTGREISELAKILKDDEKIKAVASGMVEGATWLLVCTDRRIILMDKGWVYRLNLIEIPLDKVNGVSCGKGLILASISITDSARTLTIKNVSSLVAKFFVETVYDEVEKFKRSKKLLNNQTINNFSPADEIMKYKKLFDEGIITEEEFKRKKDELLRLK